MTLRWNGDAILKDVLKASKLGMDDTTRAIAQNAKGRVRRNTGNLADEIDSEESVIADDEVVGAVGLNGKHRVIYGLIEEIRHPYMRPAVDAETGALSERIRKHFQ